WSRRRAASREAISSWMSGVWLMTRAMVGAKYSIVPVPPMSAQLWGATEVVIRRMSDSSMVPVGLLLVIVWVGWPEDPVLGKLLSCEPVGLPTGAPVDRLPGATTGDGTLLDPSGPGVAP